MAVNPSDVRVGNLLFNVIKAPRYGDYKITVVTPKITFGADGGYQEQRDQYTAPRHKVEVKWQTFTAAEANMFDEFLAQQKSTPFWFVDYGSLVPGPLGYVDPVAWYMRITSSEIDRSPSARGFYSASLALLEV